MSEITFAVLDRLREGRTDTEQEAISEAVGTINSAEQGHHREARQDRDRDAGLPGEASQRLPPCSRDRPE